MTTPSPALTRRSSRAAWRWCVTYTSLAPRSARERRRGEIRSHLWESERAGLAGVAVLLAALRGALHDLGWAFARMLPQLGRSFGTPTPYVVLAPLFPLQAWVVSAVTVGATAHIAEATGALGGGAMLGMAGGAWLWQRRRP